jgi:general stress protein YciG
VATRQATGAEAEGKEVNMGAPRKIASEQEVVLLREQGLTLAEIGRRVGISGTSVGNLLRRQGRTDLFGRRGFAAMTLERRRELASKGGKAAHAAGTAYTFSSEVAAAAGSKGGKAAHAKGTAHEFTVEEAREAGRKGGSRPKRGRRTTE